MKQILPYGLVLTMALSTTSCATIFTGTSDKISFTSSPEGAKVLHKGIEKCTTPCEVKIPRSLSKQMVTFEKDGYASQEIKLKKTFNAVSLLNILLGGAIGVGIDAATGSLTKYSPKAVTAELVTK